MRRLFAGIAFLTRVPVPGAATFDAADVGRATLAFPLVGAFLAGLLVAVRHVVFPLLPPTVAAFLLLAVYALLTGALHLDGLADMADGFGGGRTKEDVLRIMRDHLIGAYGGVALLLVVGLKASALSALLERGQADAALVAALVLGRWASVPMGRFLPYARRSGGLGTAITDHVGWTEVVGATLLALGLSLGVLGPVRGAAAVVLVACVSALQGAWCMKKIGGITGDTMGANTEVCEALVFVLVLALG
ncbi:adenosylcobinamide-GDP ribazoletransferase [Pyxidicoccus fallax]|uniref:Adenosylcobinamide-GDP ribazoletransferase n=1 Tax=Pyxidicoccus fallax TaxID=394095 RepID=A0A848LUE4_9BACT|nr:adenosylcobinamide-GDP ribazoletransferase [Pyxidicoccus fallax]NMO21240.1 adenosylcobinamide-GDP ribazoletransferase [Pyxidicoccus fallax]NPC84950.1 adenosylcobinamide-GDP ribazoletransferase [Pyxidicoccus fallax]